MRHQSGMLGERWVYRGLFSFGCVWGSIDIDELLGAFGPDEQRKARGHAVAAALPGPMDERAAIFEARDDLSNRGHFGSVGDEISGMSSWHGSITGWE